MHRKVYFCEKTARNTERREGEKVMGESQIYNLTAAGVRVKISFSDTPTASTIEESLVKILSGRTV